MPPECRPFASQLTDSSKRREAMKVGFLLFLLTILALPIPAESSETEQGAIPLEQSAAQDQEMLSRLRELYDSIPGLSRLEVSVESGVVQLQGVVESTALKNEAESIAARLENTVHVANKIQLATDAGERLDRMGDRVVESAEAGWKLAPLAAIAIAILVLFWLLSRALGWVRPMLDRILPNRFLSGLTLQFIQLLTLLAGLAIALNVVGAGGVLLSLLGGLGILGLAVSFATRDAIENYIASILLSIKQPFSPLDHVIIGDQEGKVVSLTARSTLLISLDGNHIRIPNAQVYKAVITNFTRHPERRFTIAIGVECSSDISAVRALAIQALKDTQGVLQTPPPQAVFQDFGDSSILISLFGWVDQRASDFGKVRSAAAARVMRELGQHGVEMPNPTFDINLGGSPSLTIDGSQQTRFQQSHSRPLEHETLKASDVSPDYSIDAVVRAEQQNREHQNLLDDSAPKEV